MTRNVPKLTGPVHVREDREDLFDDLGMALTAAATRAVDERGVFHLALSGGSTPERFYMRLVIDPRFRQIPWRDTHFWMVDERRVPVDDELSNFRMIRESLIDHVPVPRRQIHAIPTADTDPALVYERELRQVFDEPEATPEMDLVLLGMGDDGHTASLFPHSQALEVRSRLVVNNSGEHVPPPPRITMTYPLLNAAREVAVLVTGAKKASAIKRVAEMLERRIDAQKLPIVGVEPEDGELIWYLDAAAAAANSPTQDQI